jgi:hypothetical protein
MNARIQAPVAQRSRRLAIDLPTFQLAKAVKKILIRCSNRSQPRSV